MRVVEEVEGTLPPVILVEHERSPHLRAKEQNEVRSPEIMQSSQAPPRFFAADYFNEERRLVQVRCAASRPRTHLCYAPYRAGRTAVDKARMILAHGLKLSRWRIWAGYILMSCRRGR